MSAETVEIVERAMAAYEADDLDAQLEILDPDVELVEWPESPDQRSYRGHEGALRAAESWGEAWEWIRVDVDEVMEAGDKVLVCGRTFGKGKGSSVEVAIDTFNVYTVRDGRVTRIEFFTTEEPALRAAGLDESSKKAEEAR
jgi:ketosteroid isomerase-like protein